jgi:integrase
MPRDYGHPWNEDRTVGSRKALSQAEVRQIKAQFTDADLHDRCLFLTAIDTMLRASDLLKLRVSDVQHSNGAIKTSFPWRQKKTANGVYPVLTPSTQKALAEWINDKSKLPEHFIFTRQKSTDAEAITIGFYRTLVKSWIESIGASPEYYSAHSLRRTKATFMYERGISVEVIGRLLGHKSPASTIRYLGIDEAQAQSAALTHDIFGRSKPKRSSEIPKLTEAEINKISDQIWRKLADRLPQNLTENGE